jgi:hypothetical protein
VLDVGKSFTEDADSRCGFFVDEISGVAHKFMNGIEIIKQPNFSLRAE